MVINQQIIITSSTYSTFWSLSATGFVNPSYISGPIESPPTTPSLGFDITGVATLTIAFEGTYSGATVVHQQTEDPLGLVGWFNVQGFSGDGATAGTGGSTSGTAYSFPGLGIRHRIQVTALASGTIAARISTAEDATAVMGSVVSIGPTGTAANQVQGTAAAGAAPVGNPVQIGGTDGANMQRYGAVTTNTAQANYGYGFMTYGSVSGSNVAKPMIMGAAGQPIVIVDATNLITSAAAAGSGTLAIANAPTSVAGAAVAPQATTAVASSLILKASAGNGYRYAVTTGATAGFVMIFDATSLPANGAVTPKIIRTIAANSSLEIDHSNCPDRFSTGCVIGFSSTGPYTLTASATAALEGSVV